MTLALRRWTTWLAPSIHTVPRPEHTGTGLLWVAGLLISVAFLWPFVFYWILGDVLLATPVVGGDRAVTRGIICIGSSSSPFAPGNGLQRLDFPTPETAQLWGRP
jgi:hypothetical protein